MNTEAHEVAPKIPVKGIARVLLVDDEPVLLALTQSILRHQGFDVLTAPSAEKAIELFNKTLDPIQFLVCDINLPGKSGIYLANEISAKGDLKVVLISGDLESDTITANLNFPILAYFEKPFSMKTLAAKLTESLIEA